MRHLVCKMTNLEQGREAWDSLQLPGRGEALKQQLATCMVLIDIPLM